MIEKFLKSGRSNLELARNLYYSLLVVSLYNGLFNASHFARNSLLLYVGAVFLIVIAIFISHSSISRISRKLNVKIRESNTDSIGEYLYRSEKKNTGHYCYILFIWIACLALFYSSGEIVYEDKDKLIQSDFNVILEQDSIILDKLDSLLLKRKNMSFKKATGQENETYIPSSINSIKGPKSQ